MDHIQTMRKLRCGVPIQYLVNLGYFVSPVMSAIPKSQGLMSDVARTCKRMVWQCHSWFSFLASHCIPVSGLRPWRHDLNRTTRCWCFSKVRLEIQLGHLALLSYAGLLNLVDRLLTCWRSFCWMYDIVTNYHESDIHVRFYSPLSASAVCRICPLLQGVKHENVHAVLMSAPKQFTTFYDQSLAGVWACIVWLFCSLFSFRYVSICVCFLSLFANWKVLAPGRQHHLWPNAQNR